MNSSTLNQQQYRIGEVLRLDSVAYKLGAIRKGGMATVLLLERVGDNENIMVYKSRIACKVFGKQTLSDEQLANELNIWVNLKYKNIVPLLSLSHLNFRLAAVMPVYSNSLRDLITKEGQLSWGQFLAVLKQIADALSYAASKYDVVHLDIKPENILCHVLSGGISAHLSDWGIATIHQKNTGSCKTLQDHSQTYAGFGTLPYMAPERLLGERAANQRMDVFSLGVLAYECLLGHLPYRSQSVSDLGLEIVEGRYMEVIGASSDTLGRSGTRTLQKALNPVPERRHANAAEFYSELRWANMRKKLIGLLGA